MFKKFLSLPRRTLVLLITGYQKTLSFDHGPMKVLYPYGYCRYHPTCSEYARIAVERHGAIKGSFFAVKRLLRCHPFAKGGVDEVKK